MDRDIRQMRRVIFAMIAMNLINSVWFGYLRHWVDCIASVMWTLNFWVMLRSLRAQQKSRDLGRETDAAIMRVLTGEQD
jgi:hypothetical protein